MPKAIDRWVICFSGFLQGGRVSGIEKIEDAIHRQCHGDTTRVLLKSWKDSPADLASRIWNRCPEGGHPAIVLIGYSYGGYTAVLLARELNERGFEVETMLLIDPVFRFLGRFPSLFSLADWWTIEVPSNVRNLFDWSQKINKPSGHKIVESIKTTRNHETLMVKHQHIDDSPIVFKRAMLVACPEVKAA